MTTKDVTDKQVCEAVARYQERMSKIPMFSFVADYVPFPYEDLVQTTGQPEKVCYRAMERAAERGLIEYGTSLRTGWLTEKGKALLTN